MTWRWWRSHSVRMRLTFWYLAAMLVVLAVYVAVVYTFVSRSISQTLNQQLRADSALAAAMVDRAPDGEITWMAPEELDPDTELPWLQVWNADGTDRLFANFEAQRRPVSDDQRLASMPDNTIAIVAGESGVMRVLSRRDSIGPLPVVIQVARSEASMRQDFRELAFILVIGLPLALAVAGFGGYTLARGALAPIERMTERARHITAERLSERLPVGHAEDEMGRLATVFNETLGRLEESFEQMRRFTADVSHELRTPLTAIRSVGEVGLRGRRDEATYRSIIGSMLEEADRLATLVNRLLILSRAEMRQSRVSLEPVALVDLAEEVAGHLGVLAEEKRQTVTVERVAAPDARADRIVLRQALICLVDNAIKFTPAGGEIRIRVAETPGAAILEVVDSGTGIPPESRERIFDRFYRADGTSEGGSGLGLSIARGAVEAIGGRLTLEYSGANGSVFRIALPKAAVSKRRMAG